jgi:hypothetical protein
MQQLSRFTFTCQAFDNDMFGLCKWTAKERYRREQLTCIKCRRNTCPNPLPEGALSKEEEKNFYFDCLIQKIQKKIIFSAKHSKSKPKITKEQLSKSLKEVEQRLKTRKKKENLNCLFHICLCALTTTFS